MADYIEREALLKELATHFNKVDGKTLYHPSMALAMLDVRNAPAADVAPVVHGRWRRVYDDSAGWVDMCSKCEGFGDGTHYCPNCGAKMDGDG